MPSQEYEKFLISYGPLLQYASFGLEAISKRAEFDLMRRVVPHCPNVEFIVQGANLNQYSVEFLVPIAPYIKGIKMPECTKNNSWERFEVSANRMHKLKTITFHAGSTQAMLALFATPKRSLEMLEVGRYASTRLTEDVIGRMKRSMTNLQQFKFVTGSLNEANSYCSLLSACSNLKRVFMIHSQRNSLTSCYRLLRAVQECKKLEYINIRRSTGLKFSSTPAFKRRIGAAKPFRFLTRFHSEEIELFARPTTV